MRAEEAGERLPERWYLAAPWPQGERQLGRESERRLLASTEKAAITAPIMLFRYDNEANCDGFLKKNPKNKTQNAAGDPGSQPRRRLLNKGADQTGELTAEFYNSLCLLCACTCSRAFCQSTFKNLFEIMTPHQKKKRVRGSNSSTEPLTFHITHINISFMPPVSLSLSLFSALRGCKCPPEGSRTALTVFTPLDNIFLSLYVCCCFLKSSLQSKCCCPMNTHPPPSL